jgi:hypothetical protein
LKPWLCPHSNALADGPLVWAEHDADRLALARWACRLCTGGGRSEELGEQRVLLAHTLVGDDRCFAVAGRGDQGDNPATLEKTEDALAHSLHKLLDVLLAGCRRGVEHTAFAVGVRTV